MTEKQYDTLIIGGGHNGLVAAAYLAKAKQRVLVLEARPVVGGIAVTEEFYPGFRVDSVLHGAEMFRPQIVRDLFLKMHDFALAPANTNLFLPLPEKQSLTLWAERSRSETAIRTLSPKDADRFADYCIQMARYASFVEKALTRMPTNPTQLGASELFNWLLVGGAFRRLGDDMYGLLRYLPMSLCEWLDEWFTHPGVRAALGGAGVRNLQQGPRSGGTAFLLLYQQMGAGSEAGVPVPGLVRGGIGKLTAALASAARQFGAEIRTGTPVSQVLVENGRAVGVVLANGDDLRAGQVISSANPRHTFSELVDPYELPPSFNLAVENLRFRGGTAKVNLALERLPQFSALAPEETRQLEGRIQIGPSLTYIEQAYDAAKYGRYSERPLLDIAIPTLHDPSLAPEGKHVMSILVQYAPYKLRQSNWEKERSALGAVVLDTLAEYAPNIREAILHQQILTPLDLEQEYGLAEGNITHGEMMLDQMLFMRPVPGWASYRTPISGLYIGGAGCHPGGGVTGEPGRLVAQTVLQDSGSA